MSEALKPERPMGRVETQLRKIPVLGQLIMAAVHLFTRPESWFHPLDTTSSAADRFELSQKYSARFGNRRGF